MKGNTSRFISTILSVMLLISGFQIHSPFMYVNAAEGDPEPPPDPSFPTGIDSGRDFTVAWSDGRVAAWGNNADHQCDVPVKLRGVTAASAGAEHVIALKQDGTVVAWGDNEYGQCDAPAGLSNVIAVSAGGYHSLALKADGTVVAWGMNLNGQCNVPEVSNITAIAAGGYHSLALTADKTVVSWGYDGNGSWSTAGLTDIIAIAAPWNHSLAIKSDGTVVAWGDNFGGQLDVPAGLSNVVAVSGSLCNSLALKSDGTVVAWGGWYGDLTPDMFQPPVGLTQVTAISSEDGGCVALKTDGTIASWGDTAGHLPNGSEIIPVPRIVNAQLATDNSFMNIIVNESVCGQGSAPISLSDFQVVFNSNGGDATGAVINSIQKTNGDAITTAENELRFLLQIEGNPTGEETISIKPASGSSIFDSFGAAMDVQESTDPIQLNAVTAKLLSAQMGTDNSYFDITFNMGIYGDGGKTTAGAPDDFILTFAQNGGSASGAAIDNLTNINGEPLVGGESTLRFHLIVTGDCSGEETLEIKPTGDTSLYSSRGVAIPQSRSTAVIKVSPPAPALVSVEMAPDNTYMDATFNTGVYGQSEFTDTGDEIGINGITQMNLQLFFNRNGGGCTGLTMSSFKNTAGEDLVGGEKTIRIYLNLEGIPTGEETVGARIEVVFNSAGQGGAQDTGDIVQLNGKAPGFGLAMLQQNNRYVDVNFTMGLYRDAGCTLPVTAGDFQLIYAKNNGNTQDVTIKSVKKCDGAVEAEASDLTGGENTIRFFLELSDPAAGGEETITIKPVDAASVYGSEGIAMSADESSDTIPLNLSRPEIISAQLAEDNSFIDITFNFSVFGDSSHTTCLTPGHFYFSLHTAGATGITARAIKKPDGITEEAASPLDSAGGDATVRVFLEITGVPNGEEYFNILMGENTIYNSVGSSATTGFLTDIIYLNDARLKITSAVLSEDNQYIDVFFNRGLYGDSAHSTPVTPEHFTLLFNTGSEGTNSVTIRSVRKTTAANEDDPQGMPTGGETGLRFFLTVDGQPEGTETIELKPSAVVGKEIYNASGNPLGTQPTTGTVVLHAPIPLIVSTYPGANNAYLDITFNTGVYSDAAGTLPVVAGDFQLVFNQNDGTATGLSISSVRKNDSESETAASALTGGEKTVRLFFNVAGTADGNESYSISPAGGAAIFSKTGGAMDAEQTTGTLELASNMMPVVPEFAAVSDTAIAGRLLQYMDVTFNTGIYGDSHHSTPATAGDFAVTLTNNSLGGTNQVTIQAVTKPDSADPGVATPLAGGETVLRFFFVSPYFPNGEEIIVLNPVLNSVYSATGTAMPETSKTANRYLADPRPRIVSTRLDGSNKYIDVTFDRGMYGSGMNGEAYKTNFNLIFSKNGGTASEVLISWATKPDSDL